MKVKTIIERAGGLASAADLAREWDLTRQRLYVIERMDGFPEPVASVNGRPVWLLSEAREWRDKQTKGNAMGTAEYTQGQRVRAGNSLGSIERVQWSTTQRAFQYDVLIEGNTRSTSYLAGEIRDA